MSIQSNSLDPQISSLASNNNTPLSQFNHNLSIIFQQSNLSNTPPDAFIYTPRPHQSSQVYANTQGNLWLFQGDEGRLHSGDVYLHTHTNKHPEGVVLPHQHGYFEAVTYLTEQKQQIQKLVNDYWLGLSEGKQKSFLEDLGSYSLFELANTLQKKKRIQYGIYSRVGLDRVAQSFMQLQVNYINSADSRTNIKGTLVISRQPLEGLGNSSLTKLAYKAPNLARFMSQEYMNHREPYPNEVLPSVLYIYAVELNGKSHLAGTLDVATGEITSPNTKSIPLVEKLLAKSFAHIGTLASDLLKLVRP
jgi:hypothetical protein